MAVQEQKDQGVSSKKLVLDDRFIMTIQGKDFCIYAGLLDLAHQKGLQGITVDAVQYPTKENGLEAICRATVESKTGEVFIELGDANPKNTNQKIVNHILRMAATRAKARALRDFTNIGITCLEELGDFDEVVGDEKAGNGKTKRADPENVQAGNGRADGNGRQTAVPTENNRNGKQNVAPSNNGNGASKDLVKASAKAPAKDEGGSGSANKRESSGPKPSTAQIRAIENLARRRNIATEELETMVQKQFGTTLPNINASEASNFIRVLQQSA